LSENGELQLSTATGARVLLIAGKPLGEPIVQYGPFVMNSREEIEQALRDFRDDKLTA
jgi:redox-sensitive bicupin YhaK (pirin superfamily)